MNPWGWFALAVAAVVVGVLALAVIVAILRPDQAAKMDGRFSECPRCGFKAGSDVGPFRKPS